MKLIAVKEMIRRLACGKSKAYDLLVDGSIAFVQVGSRRMVVEASLDAYIARGYHPATQANEEQTQAKVKPKKEKGERKYKHLDL